jgi:hypothetical protein
MSAADLVETLRRRGIALSEAGGRLEVRPASALTDRDREAIRSHAADLLAALQSPRAPEEQAGEPWDREVAIKLMFNADGLVERLGVDGHHSAIVNAATLVSSASDARDMETLRFALAEFELTVRRVARERLLMERRGQNSAAGTVAPTLVGQVNNAKCGGTG